MQIPNIGSFQDGGLNENNPIRLAMWESKHLWPTLAFPDFVLSLGTGTNLFKDTASPKFQNLLVDGFIPRTYRWLKGLFDGDVQWRGLLNDVSTDRRDNFVRMNVSLPESALALDNLDGMEALSNAVSLSYGSPGEVSSIAATLLLSRLFFTLDSLPVYTNYATYHCRGTIRSRVPGHNLSKAIKGLGIDSASFLFGEEILATTMWQDDICRVCHCFCVKVEFCVSSLEALTWLTVEIDSMRKGLSSFPQTMDWFIEQQGLRAAFGRKDQGQVGRSLGCHACEVMQSKSTKRTASFMTEQSKRIRMLPSIPEIHEE